MVDPGELKVPFPEGGAGAVRQTAHEYVRSVLRRAILNGELASGSRLVQAELAATLDVSTTPIREALRDLATEGLVHFDPHRGAIVTELSSEDLQDILEIRLVLEPMAMRQAVSKITPQLLERLKKLHKDMLAEPHSAEWVDRNRVFHMAVYEQAVSARLASIIRNLQDASVMYIGAAVQRDPSHREHANKGHAEILAALEAGDAEAAVAAITPHIKIALDALEDAVPRAD